MPTRARKRVIRRQADDPQPESRFDRRLGEILYFGTNVFYDKGYAGASMRDLSRASGMSLAGLYYYFESKEKLLYLIQKHTFSTIMQMLRERLEMVTDAEQRVRIFIRNHLEYFLANLKAMKVLSHEDEALAGPLGQEIKEMKREYYQLCRGLVDDLKRDRGLPTDRISARIAVLSLFGMMNWIYTWHDPRRDVQAADLAEQMSEIFLGGLLGTQEPRTRNASRQGSTGSPPRAGVARGGAPSVGNPASQKSPARRPRTASSTI